ncbi:heme-binding domain-containing protein [Neptunitalea lumnitzerae]|uniref:Heme-binding protein n=1 Tax=Neptunitalea lumnitzerae TaxID=2965509 RepID=A0ABQ5MKR3_9FLAO|nr:heme-binding domain-containing protein [Neptunitalea sp. Y10]GLB49994.1 heme-binding protein [Neptunitalea sp. Y10]
MGKKILLAIVVIVIVMQFIQPDKNISEEIPQSDFIVLNTPPAEVATILKTSCYDCHSNNTEYPWYGNVAPVSYILANHVNDGKRHLNFSEWGKYNQNQKEHALEEIIEVVEHREMPMTSYISMHEEAALTDTEVKVLNDYMTTSLNMTSLYKQKAE